MNSPMAIGVYADLGGKWKWQIVMAGGLRSESDYQYLTWMEALVAVSERLAAAEVQLAKEAAAQGRRPLKPKR